MTTLRASNMQWRNFGYATDGQSLTAQVAELKDARRTWIFQEKVSGAKSDRKQLARVIDRLGESDVLVVARLQRVPIIVGHSMYA